MDENTTGSFGEKDALEIQGPRIGIFPVNRNSCVNISRSFNTTDRVDVVVFATAILSDQY